MRIFLSVLIMAFIFLFQACSSVTPVTNGNTPEINSEPGQPVIAGMGQIILDMNGTLEIIHARVPSWHYNVTSLLASGCPGGCFTYRILDITGEVWTIELSIENPTSTQVYDVRIIYYDTYGKEILNPDAYIEIFGLPVSPFTAFAKEYDQRAFPVGPGGIDTEILELGWPAGQLPFVSYIIEVSVGGNCDEPYRLEGIVCDEIPTAGGSVDITSAVYDWQNDNNECWCDWSSLGGSNEQMMMTSEGNGFRHFKLSINVAGGYSEGEYPILLMAKETIPGKLHLYQWITAKVVSSMTPVNLTDDEIDNSLNFTSKTVAAWDDHIYVVWAEDATGDDKPEIFLKEYDGEWLEKFMVSPETYDLNIWTNPSIAVNSSNGNVHVLWEGYADMNMALGYRNRIADTWNYHAILFRGAFCMDSQIDVEENEEVHIVFQDSDGPWLCVFWIHDPGTGTFEDPYVLAKDVYPGSPYYAPAIDHDYDGWVHVPITTGANGNNNIGYRRWNNSFWSSFSFILNDNASIWPDITVAPNRWATMIYRKDDDNLWMKQWTGAWETGEHQVTSDAGIYGIPNCDADSSGNIHLAYVSESDGDRDIYYLMYDESSNTWNSPVNLSDNESESKDPALFVGPDDTIHIVWSDDEDGDWDVYYLTM